MEELEKEPGAVLQEMEVQPIPVTAKLEQDTKETVPLKMATESQRIQKNPDMEDKHKKEELFDIVDTKIVILADGVGKI